MSTLDLPPPYPWPDGKASAFCFSMDVDAHSPWMWNNRHEVPQLLSHLEQRNFGPRVGIQRIASILKDLGVKGSFFVPGAVAEAHPWMLPALLDAGHEVGLHGYFHELVTEVSDAEFTRVLEASIEIFRKQTGETPKGFRSPAWEMTPHMLAEVKRHGFYDSSLMGFDTPHTVDGVVEVPVNWGTDDAIFFKFLGGGDPAPRSPSEILGMWRDEFEASRRFGALFMLTVHDWISGRGARPVMLESLLEKVLAESDVWVATVAEVAAHHAANGMDRNPINPDIPQTLLEHPVWTRT
ncbi:MAG: polysaccharide deacetylase [Alphaproteobacteria bacterium MedPE-SWcel]|nr:MAG: polysaccharide deacetylase [Alphaproteobacteria bacterium MedPE-SWcel]